MSRADKAMIEQFALKWRQLDRLRRASVYEFMLHTAHISRETRVLLRWVREHYEEGVIILPGTWN